MKTYITCPVTQSQERLSLLPKIEEIAKSQGLDTFAFIVGGTPEEIFKRDYSQLESCDLIIAEVSEPSHGVCIEVGLSYSLGLKRILLIQEGKRLTKLAEGMPETIILEYKNIDDLETNLSAILSTYK